jgi:hypothetical protein
MDPDEVELAQIEIRLRIGRVAAVADVEADALDADLAADVGARAGAGHRIEHPLRAKVPEQILDQLARAVARIGSAAVGTGERLVVQARQPGTGDPLTGALGSTAMVVIAEPYIGNIGK